MKRLIVFLSVIAFTQFASAQTTDTALKKQVLELIQKTGATAQVDVAKRQILAMVPKEKQAAFLVEFDASLPALYDKIADVYLEVYTKEDIQAMNTFYDSPVGKKINANAGVVAEKSQGAAAGWAQSLQSLVMKYMN